MLARLGSYGTTVQEVSESAVTTKEITQTEAETIPVIEPISFIPVGETVQKIWLDDPSFLTVDVDGCLKELNEDCDKQVATLIHLRRINQIDIPHIPHTGRTMMTVVTRGENGEQKIYLFHIKKTDKVSDLMLVINIFPFDLNTQELEP
ncbi:MAG TPA: hypothetical protein DCL61_26165 [Cyanobacteria bacterium UBA12227]|nr:hypothetical protein [Cyanobacteria bacterium UBA12227]HAX86279.1 hypothetical protein [Cyanobacteria bacterium UBA11370]HBY81203.1 hypothetical protein [Cyanobacteria bacterium UBA11148]